MSIKYFSQDQFDALIEKRVNTIATTMQDIARFTENNPELMDEERFLKITEYVRNSAANLEKLLEAIMNAPKITEIGSFTLGTKPAPKTRRPRAKKEDAEAAPAPAITAAASSAPAVRTAEATDDLRVTLDVPALTKPNPASAEAPKAANDEVDLDGIDDLEELLGGN